jgi:hypothetical protein
VVACIRGLFRVFRIIVAPRLLAFLAIFRRASQPVLVSFLRDGGALSSATFLRLRGAVIARVAPYLSRLARWLAPRPRRVLSNGRLVTNATVPKYLFFVVFLCSSVIPLDSFEFSWAALHSARAARLGWLRPCLPRPRNRQRCRWDWSRTDFLPYFYLNFPYWKCKFFLF